MPRLTKQHFEWLATEIAEFINPKDIDYYTSAVKSFARNGSFQTQKFKDRCAVTIQAKQHDDGLDPEYYNGRY